MQTKVLSLFAVLVLIIAANLSFAQAPLMSGNNHLACANYNDGPTSSDMTLIVQLDIDGNIVVNEGSPVTYVFLRSDGKALGDSLGMEWVKPEFDDSAWEKGISGVGFDDNDDNTEVKRENAAGQRDGLVIYTRYLFKVAAASAVGKVVFRADYDDAYACWLNGEEIARSANISGRTLTWDAFIGGGINHGSTEVLKGTPNPNRKYQEEVTVNFVPVVGAAVQPAGKLATSWGKIKAHY